ncbi:DUF6438 domain-containing protein [Fluviicola taffensis]|uniref:DUF6438 domain-containing protein n=1 Tax=Fluviicola taffensis TaxID=191579 RepID=UPI003137F19E
MKGYNYLLFILLVSVFISCNNSVKIKSPFQIKQELQGLWLLSDSVEEGMKHFTLYFNDNICHIAYDQSNSNRYKIKDSVLEIKISSASTLIGNRVKFKLCRIDNERLYLDPLSQNLKEYCKDAGIDTLKFQKQKHQNKFDWQSVTFLSSGCFGTCPSFIFQINKSGKILYEGKLFVKKEGKYKAKSDKWFYKLLVDKLRYIDFKSLKTEYAANWTDHQTVNFIFETKDKFYKTRVYGTYKEPRELRAVFRYIFSNYEDFKFRKTMEEYRFRQYIKDEREITPLLEMPATN